MGEENDREMKSSSCVVGRVKVFVVLDSPLSDDAFVAFVGVNKVVVLLEEDGTDFQGEFAVVVIIAWLLVS